MVMNREKQVVRKKAKDKLYRLFLHTLKPFL
jgi:hypothetical protein